MRAKVINDAHGLHQRPGKIAAGAMKTGLIKAVREAASLTAEDAAAQKVADFVRHQHQ